MFESLISPKIGLALLKNRMEVECKNKIETFSLFFHSKYTGLKFIVNTVDEPEVDKDYYYKDENGLVSSTVMSMIENELDERVQIDAFKLTSGKVVSCTVFYVYKGKKEQTEISFKNA